MSQALTLARPYARAAFSLAREGSDYAAWSNALAFAARVAADPQVTELLGHPKLSHADAVTLDDAGRFVAGKIEATTQLRPAGPSIDPERKVITLLRDLTSTAFPNGLLLLAEDGSLTRSTAPR